MHYSVISTIKVEDLYWEWTLVLDGEGSFFTPVVMVMTTQQQTFWRYLLLLPGTYSLGYYSIFIIRALFFFLWYRILNSDSSHWTTSQLLFSYVEIGSWFFFFLTESCLIPKFSRLGPNWFSFRLASQSAGLQTCTTLGSKSFRRQEVISILTFKHERTEV